MEINVIINSNMRRPQFCCSAIITINLYLQLSNSEVDQRPEGFCHAVVHFTVRSWYFMYLSSILLWRGGNSKPLHCSSSLLGIRACKSVEIIFGRSDLFGRAVKCQTFAQIPLMKFVTAAWRHSELQFLLMISGWRTIPTRESSQEHERGASIWNNCRSNIH